MFITPYIKYFLTICKHKWYVFKECAACGIIWQGIVHDLSKFSPTEFFASAKYYCGEADKYAYSLAWLHHKGCNKHHWEYWTDFDEKDGTVRTELIPYKYVVEMVCDWVGAGKVYNKDKWTNASPVEYYYKVRKGRHFNEKSERLITHFLRVIENHGLEEFHIQAKSELLKTFYSDNHVPFHLTNNKESS